MVYGILALAILYLSFFFSNVWAHLLVTVVIAVLCVKPGKLGRLLSSTG